MSSISKSNNSLNRMPSNAIFHGLIYSMTLLAVCALLLLIALKINWVRIDLLKPIYLYGIYAAVFIGALLSARNVKGRGWLIGLSFGFIFFVISAFIGTVWKGESFPISIFLLRWVTMMAVGALAGMIGINL